MTEFDQKTEALIEKYINGKLTVEEQIELEIKLSLNPDLEKDVAIKKLIAESLKDAQKKDLKTFMSKNASSKLTGNIWGKTWTRISAIFLILITVLVIFLDQRPNTFPYKMINQRNIGNYADLQKNYKVEHLKLDKTLKDFDSKSTFLAGLKDATKEEENFAVEEWKTIAKVDYNEALFILQKEKVQLINHELGSIKRLIQLEDGIIIETGDERFLQLEFKRHAEKPIPFFPDVAGEQADFTPINQHSILNL